MLYTTVCTYVFNRNGSAVAWKQECSFRKEFQPIVAMQEGKQSSFLCISPDYI